ncbi:polysaccharide deacetylase family protein [Paenibacillus ginsengihumi]|uniref:polysaccharide deacetylase family protein n=1 Tax=Paenibacillus ginsengihumi TaxID=431596 RepID=UPI00036DCAA2|nr:polysaccharide deacetylase family protein [Paenibacillus ginsengihumi]
MRKSRNKAFAPASAKKRGRLAVFALTATVMLMAAMYAAGGPSLFGGGARGGEGERTAPATAAGAEPGPLQGAAAGDAAAAGAGGRMAADARTAEHVPGKALGAATGAGRGGGLPQPPDADGGAKSAREDAPGSRTASANSAAGAAGGEPPQEDGSAASSQPQPRGGEPGTSAQPQLRGEEAGTSAQPQPRGGEPGTSAQPQPRGEEPGTSAQPQPRGEEPGTSAQPQPRGGEPGTSAQPQARGEEPGTSAQPQPQDEAPAPPPPSAPHKETPALLPGQPTSPDDQAAPPAATEAKQVALTFDDGPDAKYTPLILDILKEHDVKATFFVVGKQSEAFPDVLKRIHEEGHAIGNHSFAHADLSKLSAAEVQEDIAAADEAIARIVGASSALFRAPYGAESEAMRKHVADSGRQLVRWTVDTRDWAGTSPEEIMETVHRQLKPGGIILMHSFGGKQGKLDNTVKVLPQLIKDLREQGYRFVTVPELSAKS